MGRFSPWVRPKFSDYEGGDDEADEEGGEDERDDLTASHPEVYWSGKHSHLSFN